jgi:hypothetical protein
MPMRTQGEIEAAISEGISRFEQDYMSRGRNGQPGVAYVQEYHMNVGAAKRTRQS